MERMQTRERNDTVNALSILSYAADIDKKNVKMYLEALNVGS